jgi:hypothetical protein
MSTLLTSLLFATVVGLTADQTVLNTTYIENKLESQNAYSRLSDALSTEISKNSGDPSMSQDAVASQLKTVLTPEVLQKKIDTTLKQLQAYLQGNGPVPALDVSDLMQQAKQSGLEVQQDKFNKPVTLTATTKIKKVSDAAKLVSIGTLVATAVLLLGVLAIAIKRRNYKPLANIVFSLGTLLTLTGALMLFMPRLFNRLYKFDPTSSPFASLVHDLSVVAMHDFGLRLLIPGLTALLLGILAKFALRGSGHKQPKAKKLTDTTPDEPTSVDTIPEAPVPTDTQPQTPTSSPLPPTGQTPGAPPRPRGPRKIQL